MPHYIDFKVSGTGIVLEHKDGFLFCPSKNTAEQRLLDSVNNWAGIDKDKAQQEMALLTELIRSV